MKRESWKKFAAMAMVLAMVSSLAACGSAAGEASAPTASSVGASVSASSSAGGQKTALLEKWAFLAGRHIKVGTSCTQTGWSQDDGTGNPEGCDIDVMKYICDYYGLDLEWYVADYASLWGCVQNGLIDTIANLTTVNPDRLGLYWFTNTYAWESYSIASRAEDAPADGDMAYWNGKTICDEAGQRLSGLVLLRLYVRDKPQRNSVRGQGTNGGMPLLQADPGTGLLPFAHRGCDGYDAPLENAGQQVLSLLGGVSGRHHSFLGLNMLFVMIQKLIEHNLDAEY